MFCDGCDIADEKTCSKCKYWKITKTMDYEKVYKDALERARKSYLNSIEQGWTCDKAIYEEIFPELKESDDERIRKALIEFFSIGAKNEEQTNGVCDKDILVWLEKQKPIELDKDAEIRFRSILNLIDNGCPIEKSYIDFIKSVYAMLMELQQQKKLGEKNWLEKQCESKEKPTERQVLDYCSKISREWWQMTMDEWETLTDEDKNKYNSFIGFNYFRDTLMKITANALFQLIDTGKLEYEEGSLLLKKPDYTSKPLEVINTINEKQVAEVFEKVGLAKVVRELANNKLTNALQDAMIELGKQLKPVEWSEKDEKILNSIIEDVMSVGECPDYPTEEEKEYFYEGQDKVNWLKSLKDKVYPQVKQKWSEEDERILASIIDDTVQEEQLGKSQIDWLKSLRYRILPQPKQELTEFEKAVKQVMWTAYNYDDFTNERDVDDIYNVRATSKTLLDLARKELQPEFDEEMEEIV